MNNWRINLIFIFIFLFGAAIISKLFFIQILQDNFYKALTQGLLYTQDEEVRAQRGKVFFQNGEYLAINMEWPLIFSSPQEIKDKEETAKKLSEVLNLSEDFILKKLRKDSLYEVIKKRLTEEEVEIIQELKLKGVYLGTEIGRYYPQEALASPIIGFLDGDEQGQYGLEEFYDETLNGEKGNQGSDLIVTLDYSIQFTAEKLLERAKEDLDIEGGEILVIEPGSGKILALANFPNFNPNEYSEVADFDVFQNSLTQKIFEPGSVFKPITMAAALDQGKITPSTTYNDPGVVEIGGWPIYNYERRTYPGDITMTEVLEKSINTGAVFVEGQLGHNIFLEYIERFGIFEATGVDVREIYSENKEFKNGYEINFATASFGQGIEMTPIQLVRAYCVIANGGKLVKPYLVEKIKNKDEILETATEIEDDSIISSKTASQLTAMLISVVENGYAKSARIPGYYVAGKTGTAQIAWSALDINKKGYSDKTWQTFIGFAPAFNPQFLILVKLNNPKTKTAEYSAVPIFHDLAEYIIHYYQIPPDYE